MQTRTFSEWLHFYDPAQRNVIPPMTHPLHKGWQQPELSEITICEKYATMNKEAFDKLTGYCGGYYRWAYEGKMCKEQDIGCWHLHWWGFSDDPTMCSGNRREIKII